MKKFKVTISSQAYSTYIVEAEDEEQAADIAMSGEEETASIDEFDFEVDGIEEIK